MVGLTTARALKLQGDLVCRTVVIVVNSGATHNFICEHLVAEMGVPVVSGKKFKVVVGDGHRREGRGFYPSMKLEIQVLVIDQPYFSFPISGSNVILCMSWLKTLGEVHANWRRLTMAVIKRRTDGGAERGSFPLYRGSFREVPVSGISRVRYGFHDLNPYVGARSDRLITCEYGPVIWVYSVWGHSSQGGGGVSTSVGPNGSAEGADPIIPAELRDILWDFSGVFKERAHYHQSGPSDHA